jgi:hypothetical protein
VASNDPQRNRAKTHRPEISLWYRTNVCIIEFKYGTKSPSRCLSRLRRLSAAVATNREDHRKLPVCPRAQGLGASDLTVPEKSLRRPRGITLRRIRKKLPLLPKLTETERGLSADAMYDYDPRLLIISQ